MKDTDRFQITFHDGWWRATVWTEHGTSSKTCHDDGEAFAFIHRVRTQRTWVKGGAR